MNIFLPSNINLSAKYFIIIIMVLLTISGCAAPKVVMHQNDEVDVSQQAVIKVEEREGTRGQVTIAQVDGKETVETVIRLFNGGKYAGEVYILSGKHRIAVHSTGVELC